MASSTPSVTSIEHAIVDHLVADAAGRRRLERLALQRIAQAVGGDPTGRTAHGQQREQLPHLARTGPAGRAPRRPGPRRHAPTPGCGRRRRRSGPAIPRGGGRADHPHRRPPRSHGDRWPPRPPWPARGRWRPWRRDGARCERRTPRPGPARPDRPSRSHPPPRRWANRGPEPVRRPSRPPPRTLRVPAGTRPRRPRDPRPRTRPPGSGRSLDRPRRRPATARRRASRRQLRRDRGRPWSALPVVGRMGREHGEARR